MADGKMSRQLHFCSADETNRTIKKIKVLQKSAYNS